MGNVEYLATETLKETDWKVESEVFVERVDEALVYVKENFTKNINMAMVANHVSINYTWFSEKFKEHMGMNFNEYLKRLRIEEACRLLEKDCYKVYEVSERSGFGDVKYFMKIFKEATGLSPTEWKKQHLTDN